MDDFAPDRPAPMGLVEGDGRRIRRHHVQAQALDPACASASAEFGDQTPADPTTPITADEVERREPVATDVSETDDLPFGLRHQEIVAGRQGLAPPQAHGPQIAAYGLF